VGRRDERRNGATRPDNRPHRQQQQRRRSPEQHVGFTTVMKHGLILFLLDPYNPLKNAFIN
jgi:hypothetical protein